MIADRVPRATRDSARQRHYALCLALFAALVGALPLVIAPGIVNTRAGGDSLFLVQRVHQLAQNLRAGVIPARWMPEAAYGLGYPAFNFYAALPYYLAGVLHLAGLSIPLSIQITQVLGFLLAGGAAYGLARGMGARQSGALLASVAYSFSPFHLVNVYVRGDSLSEFYAFALYALLLWAILRLARRPSSGRVAAVAVAYAVLIATHNVSALVFSPVAGAWLLAQLLGKDWNEAWRILFWGGLALALGLLMSFWFWGPALGEQSLVQLQAQTTGYLNYTKHFRGADLVEPHLLHDYGIYKDHDPFAMGAVQAVVALLAVGACGVGVWRARRAGKPLSLSTSRALLLLTLVGYTWLITPSSQWVWDHLPLLPYCQFPWRLLSVQALAIALLAPAIVEQLRGQVAAGVVLVLSLVVIVGGIGGLVIESPDRIMLAADDVTPARLMLYETYSGNIGTTIRHEYLPREMVPRPYTSAVQLSANGRPAPLALEGRLVSAQPLENTPRAQRWRVEAAEPTMLAFHTTAYAGWRATVGGQSHALASTGGLGLLGLRLAPGEHEVYLEFGATPIRRVATWGSVVGLLIWAALLVWLCWRSPRYRLVMAVICGVLVLGVGWLDVVPVSGGSERSVSGPLVMDFDRAPYLHHEPEGIYYNSTVLESYRYSCQEAVPGETLMVETTWREPLPRGEVQIHLLAASAHLFSPRPTWAVGRAPLDERVVPVAVELPSTLPPGLYVLRIKVYVGDEQIEPSTSRDIEMDNLVLAPVQVDTHRAATGDEPVLGSYGPANMPPVISLIEAEIGSSGGRYVEVRLTWRSERQAPLNYGMSIRLDKADGDRLLSRDIPPLMGGYPTSLWQAGELISDRIPLKLDDVVAPDDAYDLTVILYDRVTLGAVGTTTLRGIRPAID